MQDRRITKSQDAIKSAFIQLMCDKNIEQITIQDITRLANVGRRTFYHHYTDKYDLQSKLIEEHLEELRRICTSSMNEPTDQNTEYFWFDYFEENYQFFSVMLAGQGQAIFRQLFLQFISDELKMMVDFTNGQNKGITEEVYLTFFASAIIGVIEDYFMKGIPETSHELAEQVMTLLDRNI